MRTPPEVQPVLEASDERAGQGAPGASRARRAGTARRPGGDAVRPAARALAAACGLVALAPVLAPAPALAQPASVPESVPGLVGGRNLAGAFDVAVDGRVDIVMLGDSNQLFAGHGWDEAWHIALRERLPLFATGLLAAGENFGNGAGTGWNYGVFSTARGPEWSWSGAPPELDRFMDVNFLGDSYLHLAYPRTTPGTQNMGMFVYPGALDTDAPLRFHYVFGGYRQGTAQSAIRPEIRLEAPPFPTLVSGAPVSVGWVRWEPLSKFLDLPAGQRHGNGVAFRWAPFSVEPGVRGPFVAYWLRCEQLDRPRGMAVSSLWKAGGRSARFMASRLGLVTDETLTLYFSLLRSLQGPRKAVVVRICQGLNDRNDTNFSVTLGVPSNTPEGYRDNILSTMNRLRGIWALNNWPAEELYFVITPSHPISAPDDASLLAYREVAEELSRTQPRTAAVRLDVLTSTPEMLANGWYERGGEDRFHLTRAGFLAVSRREIAALFVGACLPDLTRDGELTFDDALRFVQAFSAGEDDADINGDGEVTFDDIQAWVGAYNRGCGGY